MDANRNRWREGGKEAGQPRKATRRQGRRTSRKKKCN